MIPGQKYTVTVPAGVGVAAPASNFDLFQIAPGSGVPLYLHRVTCSAAQVSAVSIPIALMRRSSASTVSVGSVTPVNDSPAGPAASAVITYCLTTLGTAGTVIDAPMWEEFAPYDFNYYPDGKIIVPGTWCCLYMANSAIFQAGFTIEFTEVK